MPELPDIELYLHALRPHLMIAGRFRFLDPGAKVPGRVGLAAFDFEHGSLILTEAGSKRRASLYLVRGEAELASHDPGELEVLTSTVEQFGAALTRENHTLKRADRPAPVERRWQRLLRRDPGRGQDVADGPDEQADAGPDRATPRVHD